MTDFAASGSTAQCQNQNTDQGSEANVQAAIPSTGQRRETPLPWGKLSSLLAVRLSEPVNFTLILPFVYQMVRDFGVAKSPKDIAFYAGLLFTSFSVCQTLMVMHWGRLSDRIGRRPVIMIGLVGNLVSSVLLGTSKSFKAAILARSFNGLMAGNVVVVKSMVAEISDSTNRPRMMAMIPLMWNLGSVAGSAVGGLFADPVNQYPRWFGNSVIFREYPYLLPCLIGCSVTTFGLIVGLFKLEETLVFKKDVETPATSATSTEPTTPASPASSPAPAPAPATALVSASASSLTLSTENTPLLDGRPQQRGIRELLTPTVIRVMTTNVFVCVSSSMGEQAYPIFAATNINDGGLGLSTRDIGISLAIASIAVIYLQLVTYPRLERKYVDSRDQITGQMSASVGEAIQCLEPSPRQMKETPLPWGKLSSLLAVRLSEPVNFTLILPFVYQMVRDFGIAKSPKDIAFYAGLLFTSFSVCQTLMVMHWGRLSDRIGRKPVLMLGLVGNLISSVLLGTSKTFKAAIIARSFNGLMAGNVVVVKTMVAEISDNTNRPRMMAMTPLMWNLGSVAGSAVGGLFADPVNQYPRWFGNSVIFKEYPYLLPCLIGCSVTIFGLVVGLFKLEETLVFKKDLEIPATPLISTTSTTAATPVSAVFSASTPSSTPVSASASSLTLSSENTPLLDNGPQQRGIRELLTPTVVRVMATNVMVCLSMSIGDQAYPIFAATDPADGGLGLSSSDIGISLAIASVAVIYLQLITYPRMERLHGALGCYKKGQRISVLFCALFPFINMAARQVDVSTISQNFPSASRVLLWIMLVSLLLVRVVGTVLMMTSVNLLTANLAPTKAELGFMNGAQQLAMSSTRIIGPLLSGTIWSWSIKHSWPFPFNFHFVWNISALMYLFSTYLSSRIPQSVNIFSADRPASPN
ncbi:hypothetical protein FB645_002921 [Coemansia sp. IMI 203386]|nr:hypothetical protein FB645_002921 [Coemansia sp. IMI 203386]